MVPLFGAVGGGDGGGGGGGMGGILLDCCRSRSLCLLCVRGMV